MIAIARLTEFNSTTNSSFHDDVHFPLGDPLYAGLFNIALAVLIGITDMSTSPTTPNSPCVRHFF